MTNRRKFLKHAGALSLLPALSFPLQLSCKEEEKRSFASSAIIPPRLSKGDTVGIVSPAGAIFEKSSLEEFRKVLVELGFTVKEGKNLHKRSGYFAGSDEERAEDLMDMFGDKEVKGIFCAKGGWGCARILPLLDYELIKKNPKPLTGFSDITSLLNAVTLKTGMVTYHGPVGNSGWNDFSRESFRAAVMKEQEFVYHFSPEVSVYAEGTAEGTLFGGNLSVLCSMIGTPWMPSFDNPEGCILMLEETTEEPYRIDRMLTQLDQSGIFSKVKAVLFGKCTKCLAEEPEKAFTAEEVFTHHFAKRKIPVVAGLEFGHTVNKLTLPIGGRIRISTRPGSLRF